MLIHLTLLPVAGYYLQELSASTQPPMLEIEFTVESNSLPNYTTAAPALLTQPSQPLSGITSPAPAVTAAVNQVYQPPVPDNSNSDNTTPVSAVSPAITASVQAGTPSGTVATVSANSPAAANPQAAAHTIISPRILQKFEPEYPEQARRKQLRGAVILKVEIPVSGKPQNISILSSSGYTLLDQAAIDAVQQWSFIPAKDSITGEAVGCITHIPFVFRTN